MAICNRCGEEDGHTEDCVWHPLPPGQVCEVEDCVEPAVLRKRAGGLPPVYVCDDHRLEEP